MKQVECIQTKKAAPLREHEHRVRYTVSGAGAGPPERAVRYLVIACGRCPDLVRNQRSRVSRRTVVPPTLQVKTSCKFRRGGFTLLELLCVSTVTFSRTGVALGPAPAHHATNGFDHLEPYVSRLLVPTNRRKFLSVFTPDGHRGFGLHAKDGVVEAGLTVERRQEPEREAAIGSFFTSIGITPSRDYLASNGGVPDATRILHYPIQGSAAEVTALTKRILQELCGVSPSEALAISYSEKCAGRLENPASRQ